VTFPPTLAITLEEFLLHQFPNETLIISYLILVGFRVVVDNDAYEDATLVKVRTPLAESYIF
jgi:hypothetical protein